MLHRVNFYDGNNMRGRPQHFGQRELFGNPHNGFGVQSGNGVNVQLNERRDWLFHLGLSPSCAHDLAVHTLEQPEFNLTHFQQHWKRLSLQLGLGRQAEVDAIVLRKIRELLHRQMAPSSYPRTPSPPRGINWNSSRGNSPDCDPIPLAYLADNRNDHYPERRLTSTPVGEMGFRPPDLHRREPDVYNIDADPRNLEDNFHGEQANHFTPYNNNNNNYRNLNYPTDKVYNIDSDPRNIEDDFAPPHTNNFVGCPVQHIKSSENNAFFKHNYHRRLPALSSDKFHFNREQLPFRNLNNVQFQNALEPTFRRLSGRNDAGNNKNLNSNQLPNIYRDRGPHRTENTAFSNARNGHCKGRGCKRAAEPSNGELDQNKRKRRIIEQVDQLFKIGDFEMPYLQSNWKPLPQPESKSYAIKFFRRKHCSIVGGKEAVPPQAPARNTPILSLNYSRAAAKRFRQALRDEWTDIYRNMNYRSWDIWWKDFKWCEAGIDKELERFKGINLRYSFLHVKMSYDRPEAIKTLLHSAHLALELNKTNFQSIMGTIFELTNESFLEKLDSEHMCQLQDIIRYIPNHLWVYKMRSMVYLWSRYSRIRTSANPSNRELWATQTQWNSALFHWLAKQAYVELKTVSEVEWTEHSKMYPLL
ncbi:uncharacterized protein LOC135426148 [Drosophila montana]|uniref:uncharacterized protein LOC135426148 n=1 Tax=Drosophila montana TaxID=40370 RepID=UPI00313C6D29